MKYEVKDPEAWELIGDYVEDVHVYHHGHHVTATVITTVGGLMRCVEAHEKECDK